MDNRNVSVVHVQTPGQFSAMCADVSNSRVVAVDFETTGLDALSCDPVLLALKGETGPAYVLDTEPTPAGRNLGTLVSILGLKDKVLVAHNAVFEYMFFRTHCPADRVPEQWFCTQVAEGLIQAGLRGEEERRVSLAEVYGKYCGVQPNKELQTSFVAVDPTTFTPTEAQVRYAAQDVTYLHEVMGAQLRRLEAEALMRVCRLEMRVIVPLGEMQLNGFYLNLDRHQLVLEEYVAQEATQRAKVEETLAALYTKRKTRENVERAVVYAELTQQIEAILPGGRKKKDTPEDVMLRVGALRKVRDGYKPLKLVFNLSSHFHVWEALAEAGTELYVQDWDEQEAAYVKRPSLDKTAVQQASEKANANPVLVEYAAWAKANKVISTYGAPLAAKVHARTGRVHSEYNQLVDSGRLSSNHPNAQNMPKRVRECFEATVGNVLISADGKNQEGRIAAALSEDPTLLEIFRKDYDWHSMTAAVAYPEKFADWHEVDKESPERKRCKNANFSRIYGGVSATLYSRGYVPSLEVGDRVMAAGDKLTPQLTVWVANNAQKALDLGYGVTASGRKRYFRMPEKPRYDKTNQKPYARWKHIRGSVRRAAMNHPIQGTGADIMKQAMVFLYHPLEALNFKLVCMVHDSLVYEGPEDKAQEAKAIIEAGFLRAAKCFITNLDIPGEAEVMHQWH